MTLLRITAIICAGFLLSGQSSEESDLDSAFPKDTLIISADEHACYFFDIYVASTRAQQMRGLMHVRNLPEMTGMIFSYRRAGTRSMWMKNTYIPLDLVFIHADGRIANIVVNAEPHSLNSRVAAEPVNYVLELNGGVTEKLSIDSDSLVLLMQ